MSTDKTYNEKEILPFFISHKPRFVGAGKIENALYALVIVGEGLYLLLTCWSDRGVNWSLYASDWLHKIFYRERTPTELKEFGAKP